MTKPYSLPSWGLHGSETKGISDDCNCMKCYDQNKQVQEAEDSHLWSFSVVIEIGFSEAMMREQRPGRGEGVGKRGSFQIGTQDVQRL